MFENTMIVRKWREYAGAPDERLEAESCKIYRVGFVPAPACRLPFRRDLMRSGNVLRNDDRLLRQWCVERYASRDEGADGVATVATRVR